MTPSDKATKKIVREGIERASADLSARLAHRGFERSKKRIWTRALEHHADFVILECEGSTYGAPLDCGVSLELSCGIRILNDSFEALALNGPRSDAKRTREGRYHLRFDAKSGSTYERCIDDLERFVVDEGEPWFEALHEPAQLAANEASPLRPRARELLEASIRGESTPDNIARSRKLLGLRG